MKLSGPERTAIAGSGLLGRGRRRDIVHVLETWKARTEWRTFAFRFGCRNRDVDLLRAGGSQSVVHSGIRRRVRSGIALWIPAGRLSLWCDWSHMGRGRGLALVQ